MKGVIMGSMKWWFVVQFVEDEENEVWDIIRHLIKTGTKRAAERKMERMIRRADEEYRRLSEVDDGYYPSRWSQLYGPYKTREEAEEAEE